MKVACPNCGFEGEIFESRKCARCGEVIPVHSIEETEDPGGTNRFMGPGRWQENVTEEIERDVEAADHPEDDFVKSLEESDEALEKEVEETVTEEEAFAGEEAEEVAAWDEGEEHMEEKVIPEDIIPEDTVETDKEEEGAGVKFPLNQGEGVLYPRIFMPPEKEDADRELQGQDMPEPVQEDLPLYEKPAADFGFPEAEVQDVDIMNKRLWAGLIDIGLVLGMNILAFLFISFFGRLDFGSFFLLPAYPFLIVTFLMTTGYFVFFSGFSGQTPGKMFMHIQIIDQTGNLISFSRSFIRYVGYYISFLAFCYGFIAAYSDPNHKAWHDRLARTRVEYIGEED